MVNRWGKSRNSDRFYFLWLQNHRGWCLWPQNQKILSSWKKSYDKSRLCIKKQIYHFADKFSLVKAMVFPTVMYGYEIWTIRKAECQRIDVFELRCQRRFLRISWIARRSNQSILKEINPEYSLKGLMLKLQYFGHLMQELTHWKRP